MASIKDVARLANVSPATVSRVLNNSANVKEEKRNRVLAAVEETGFRTMEDTKQLYKKSSKTICVIVPSSENALYDEVVKAIERQAFQKGYRILLCSFEENVEKELSNLQLLSRVKADGIIITANNHKISKVVSKCQLPIVVYDRQLDFNSVIAYIESDHHKGGRLAMDYLIECGCKNIVFLRGPMDLSCGKNRYMGYKSICDEYGIKEQYLDCGYTYEDGIRAAKEILNKYPTVDGIIASNDIVAMAVHKVLKRAGYKIPEDIQIIGFDNIRLSAQHSPGISTITQRIEEMGTLAVQIILDYFNELPFQKENIFDVSVVERQTTKRKELKYEKTGDFEQ